MARVSKNISFKGAVLDKDTMTITEYTKDSMKSYDLMKLIEEFDQVENISLTIKVDDERPED